LLWNQNQNGQLTPTALTNGEGKGKREEPAKPLSVDLPKAIVPPKETGIQNAQK
jgi:hypothetical protein